MQPLRFQRVRLRHGFSGPAGGGALRCLFRRTGATTAAGGPGGGGGAACARFDGSFASSCARHSARVHDSALAPGACVRSTAVVWAVAVQSMLLLGQAQVGVCTAALRRIVATAGREPSAQACGAQRALRFALQGMVSSATHLERLRPCWPHRRQHGAACRSARSPCRCSAVTIMLMMR